MATQNRIRSLNRLPFDFEDGITTCGIKTGIKAGNNLNLTTGKNFIEVVIDNSLTSPVTIAGDNNLVIVLAKDNTVSNTVLITGNNNVVLMNEAGTGTIGLRVSGNQNHVSGRVTGGLTVSGDFNVFSLFVAGNTTFESMSTRNVMTGICNGSFVDLADGNNRCAGILDGQNSGYWSALLPTGGNGLFTFDHGCKTIPKVVMVTPNGLNGITINVTTVGATSVTVKCFDAAGAPIENAQVGFGWYATI